MNHLSLRIIPRLAGIALVTGLALAAVPAQARGPVGGTGQSAAITVRATVKSIDLKTRHVTLVGPEGNAFTVKIGPAAHNLDQVKAGANSPDRELEPLGFGELGVGEDFSQPLDLALIMAGDQNAIAGRGAIELGLDAGQVARESFDALDS